MRRLVLWSTVAAFALVGCGGSDDEGAGSFFLSLANREAAVAATLRVVTASRALGAPLYRGAAVPTLFEPLPPGGDVACSGGGTRTIAIVDADATASVTAGDRVTALYDACGDVSGEIVSGATNLTVTDLLSSYLSYRVEGPLEYRSLVSARGALVSGVAQLSYSELRSMAGENSNALLTFAAGFRAGITLPVFDNLDFGNGFAVRRALSLTSPGGAAGSQAVSLDGRFTSARLGGELVLATSSSLQLRPGQDYPLAGIIEIRAQGPQTLRVTALDATLVKLEFDGDGDGAFEFSETRAWTSLPPA
jgi:hypothetical protein